MIGLGSSDGRSLLHSVCRLIQRMRLEFANQQAIFDLPARRWWLPAADGGRAGFVGAVSRSRGGHAGRARVGAAVADGPEPGALLARRRADHGAQDGPGQRRAEDLAGRASTRPTSATTSSGRRSCGSHDSLDQYVQGAMLIHMLRHAPEVFGQPFGDVSMSRHERRDDLRHVDRLRPGRHPARERSSTSSTA